MNVDRTISSSRVKGIPDNVVHLVDVDAATNYLVQIWTLLIPQFSNRQSTQSLRVESFGLKRSSYFGLVHKPWHKVLVILAEVLCHQRLEHVRKRTVPNVMKQRRHEQLSPLVLRKIYS